MRKAIWTWLACFIWFTIPIVYQYYTFQLTWHDTGALYHMILNIFDYGYFYATDEFLDHSSEHFTPFWLLIALPIKIFGMFSFVLLGCAALATAGWCLFALTKHVTKSLPIAGLALGAFLLHPYVSAINLYPHYEVFGVALLLLYAYCMTQEKTIQALICFALALTVKEDFWIYGAIVPILIWDKKQYKILLGSIGGALAYKLLVLTFLWDYLYPVKYDFINIVWNYPAKGEIGIVLYLLSHLPETLPKVFTGHGFDFLLSFLFLLVLCPLRFFFIAGMLFLWVNATAIDRYQLAYYYSYPMLTLSLITLPYAFNRLKKFRYLGVAAAGALLLCSLILQIKLPEGLRRSPNLQRVFSQPLQERDFKLLRMIDRYLSKDKESVYTQFPIASYIPKRKDFYVSFAYAKKVYSREIKPTYVLLDENRWDTDESGVTVADMISSFRKDPGCKILKEYDGIFLFHCMQPRSQP